MNKNWILGCLSIFLILLLLGYNAKLQKEIAIKEAQVNMTNLANSVEMDLKRAFFGLDQLFIGLENFLGTFKLLENTDQPEIRRVIDELILKNNYLTALNVIDENGQVIAWNNNYQKINLSERQYFQVHKRGGHEGLFIGLPQPSLLNQGQWIFGISKAIRRPDGSLQMVLAAIIDLKYFQRQYESLFSQPGTSLTISSPDGEIYTRIPGYDGSVGQQDSILARNSHNTAENSEILLIDSIDGKTQLSIVRHLDQYPLVVHVSKMESTVLASWKKSLWIYSILSVVTCLVILFMSHRTAVYHRRQKEVKEKLAHQAITDPLTKLANRRYILNQATLEIKKAKRSDAAVSLIYLDVDFFKKFNEKHGFKAGDKILIELAEVLKNTCRETDLVSRFDSDEFLLLLPLTNLDGALVIAERLRSKIEAHQFKPLDANLKITVSLGVSQRGNDEMKITGGLNRAKRALEQAKESGRNKIKWLHSNLRDESSIWIEQRLK